MVIFRLIRGLFGIGKASRNRAQLKQERKDALLVGRAKAAQSADYRLLRDLKEEGEDPPQKPVS